MYILKAKALDGSVLEFQFKDTDFDTLISLLEFMQDSSTEHLNYEIIFE